LPQLYAQMKSRPRPVSELFSFINSPERRCFLLKQNLHHSGPFIQHSPVTGYTWLLARQAQLLSPYFPRHPVYTGFDGRMK